MPFYITMPFLLQLWASHVWNIHFFRSCMCEKGSSLLLWASDDVLMWTRQKHTLRYVYNKHDKQKSCRIYAYIIHSFPILGPHCHLTVRPSVTNSWYELLLKCWHIYGPILSWNFSTFSSFLHVCKQQITVFWLTATFHVDTFYKLACS